MKLKNKKLKKNKKYHKNNNINYNYQRISNKKYNNKMNNRQIILFEIIHIKFLVISINSKIFINLKCFRI